MCGALRGLTPDTWSTDTDQLGISNTRARASNFGTVMHTGSPNVGPIMDGVAELGQEILDASDTATRPSDDRTMWALFFLARCLDAFGSIRMLVEQDRVVDAMAVTRMLYEAEISFLYIYGVGDDRIQERERLLLWRRQGLRQVLRRERHLADLGIGEVGDGDEIGSWVVDTVTSGVKEIDAELAELGAAKKADPNVFEKATELGLENTYAIVYRDSSAAMHTSPMLLGEYLLAGGRGGQRMADSGPMLLIVGSQVIARLCAEVGGIVGFAASERAGEYSARLARLA